MSLTEPQAEWLFRFTAGAVPLPVLSGNDAADPAKQTGRLQMQLEAAQSREWAEEKALKAALLAKAFAVVDKHKDDMRQNFDLVVTTYKDPLDDDLEDEDKARGKMQKSGTREQVVRDKAGRQERAYDAKESTQLASAARGRTDKSLTATDATKAMAILTEEKNKLAGQMTPRSHIDEKSSTIVQKLEPLFSDDEIMNELYTPLVRELVLPETFVPDKYSATQKMIEGSDDYYIKECKSKGKKVNLGLAEFGKGAVAVGSAVASAVTSGLAPISAGQQGTVGSGVLSKDMAARAADITTGVAAALTGTIDAIDQIDDIRNSGDFPSSGLQKVVNGFGLAIGKIVAGATGNMEAGIAVTDAITGGGAVGGIVAEVANWRRKGGEPPVGKILDMLGQSISTSLDAAGRNTDGEAGVALMRTGQGVTAVCKTVQKVCEAKLLKAMKEADWKTVFDVFAEFGKQVGGQLPNEILEDSALKDQSTYSTEAKVQAGVVGSASSLDKGASGAKDVTDQLGKIAVDELGDKVVAKTGIGMPKTGLADRMAEAEKRFAAKEKELKDAEAAQDAQDVAKIEKQLAAEKEEFRKSLSCLGSKEPKDADFKSLAKLVEQLERDRKIWDGLFAIFPAGIGAASGVTAAMTVASEVAPALKLAGQLVTYCMNVKAAADRLSAWLDWHAAAKDAESSVSPYATSIANFTKNQGQQFTHYTLQAAANATQALLACGGFTPYAPAFAAAGAAVGAAASTENVLYQFYKQAALRRAWKHTKRALDPKNRGNRKMALIARRLNPTLAKYTIAYGALVEEAPVAITACNRIGIDRETLTRSSDKVKELKDYLEKLYPEDGTVLGVLDVNPKETGVPEPVLTTKAWALSYLVWTEKRGLTTKNPPAIVANLAIVEKLEAQLAAMPEVSDASDPDDQQERDEIVSKLLVSLGKLKQAQEAFDPRNSINDMIAEIKKVALAYADLADAQKTTLELELGAEAVPATN